VPADPRHPPGSTIEARLLFRVADLERQLRTLSSYFSGGSTGQFPILDAPPAAGRLGRAFVLSTDGKLYVDNGTTWIPQT
jgi:hypothetical protein